MTARKSSSGLSRTGPATGFYHSEVEPKRGHQKGKPMKNCNMSSASLRRLPGLFRRWELNEILELQCCYQIEDAGAHSDGTPLVAVYACDPFSETSHLNYVDDDASASEDPRSIIPDGLLPTGLASRLPLIIEMDVHGDDAPQMMPLFTLNGATLADLYLAILGEREIADAARRTDQALSVLLDRLLAHGATPETGVFAALGMIAVSDTAEART